MICLSTCNGAFSFLLEYACNIFNNENNHPKTYDILMWKLFLLRWWVAQVLEKIKWKVSSSYVIFLHTTGLIYIRGRLSMFISPYMNILVKNLLAFNHALCKKIQIRLRVWNLFGNLLGRPKTSLVQIMWKIEKY